jgi:4-carboxymuconolactone decarboxylase
MTQRLDPPAPDSMEPAQRLVHDAIIAGPRGKVEGPLGVWLHSAELADRAQALGAFCRYGSTLPPHLSELAILVTGAFWRAGFEWHVHAPIAEGAGIAPAAIAAIRRGEAVTFEDPAAQAVHDVARELWTTQDLSDATYLQAEVVLGTRAMVDLVGVLGYYGLISMTIKAFRVRVPDGAEEPF